MSQVSKLHKVFLTCSESEERLIFESFSIVFMESSISTFQYIFSNFHLVCKLFQSLFYPFLLVSKLFKSSIWIMYHTLEMTRYLNINLYLRPFSIAIYGKLSKLFLSVPVGGYKPCFETKNCSKFSYICVLIFSKKQRSWF